MKLKLLTTLGLVFFAMSAFAQGPAGAGLAAQEATEHTTQQTTQQNTQQQTPAAPQCLIVTSAEGHRFRNSMIAGVLTGGIGLVAAGAFSGGRYEYRDSVNISSSEVKMKYKGPELQKLQQNGVHVVVVDKKDKSGTSVKDARASCQEMT